MRRVVVALVVGSVLSFGTTAAQAVDPGPGCPTAPDSAYTGPDDAAHELRELRREQAQACDAITAAINGVTDTTSPLAGNLATLHADLVGRGHTAERPLYVTGDTNNTNAAGTDDDHPLHVTPTAATASSSSDAWDAIHGDIWFVIGALIGTPFVFFLLREVLPWRS